MAVPDADTLDAASHKEMKECGGTFGSNNPGSCSGEALNRAMTNSLDTVFGKLMEVIDGIPNTYVGCQRQRHSHVRQAQSQLHR